MFTKINFCLHFGLIVHTLYKSMLVLPIFFRIIYIFFNVLNSSLKLKYLVGSNGIEPSTSRLSGVRSNHLSYEPIYLEFFS